MRPLVIFAPAAALALSSTCLIPVPARARQANDARVSCSPVQRASPTSAYRRCEMVFSKGEDEILARATFTGASATAKAAMAIAYNRKTCSDPTPFRVREGKAHISAHCYLKTEISDYLIVTVTVDYHDAALQSFDVTTVRLSRKQRGGLRGHRS